MPPAKVQSISADLGLIPGGPPAVSTLASRRWGNNFNYRALFEQSDECIFIINFDLHYLAVNPQVLTLLGYQESELIGQPVSDIVYMDETLNQDASDTEAHFVERYLRRKDDSLVPVEISTSLVYDEAGKPVYIQSIARDISRRKQIEQALKHHNQILLSISEATTRLLQSSQIETTVKDVLELLGKSVKAVSCSLVVLDAKPGPHAVRLQAEWRQADAGELEIAGLLAPFARDILKQPGGFFARNIQRLPIRSFAAVRIEVKTNARSFLVLFYPEVRESAQLAQQDALQIAANVIGAALQRSQREETILVSEARHRSIIAALPDLIIRLDADGRILDYSARLEHPLYSPAPVVAGKLLSEIWPPEIAHQIIGPNLSGSFTVSHHLREFKLPFSPHTYESRLAPIASDEALLVIRDVTEQTQLNEMKSDFINRASHELRTPLTTVIMMANLIQEGGTPTEMKEYWGVMTSELNRQKILIERLLMAGRLESGTMKLELGAIDLYSSLDESIQAVKPIANKKNISIEFTPPSRLVTVLGDRSALQQVFINLINNATKFSPPHTSVEIGVELSAVEARISISDHGMGIPPEDLPHMCERFFRGRNVTIAEVPGSGIGLYIVKSILEELNGGLEIESTLKKGTTLIVKLRRMG